MIDDRGCFGEGSGEEAVLKKFNYPFIGWKAFRVGKIPHHVVFGHVYTLNLEFHVGGICDSFGRSHFSVEMVWFERKVLF